jgi:hypothetical protein
MRVYSIIDLAETSRRQHEEAAERAVEMRHEFRRAENQLYRVVRQSGPIFTRTPQGETRIHLTREQIRQAMQSTDDRVITITAASAYRVLLANDAAAAAAVTAQPARTCEDFEAWMPDDVVGITNLESLAHSYEFPETSEEEGDNSDDHHESNGRPRVGDSVTFADEMVRVITEA